MERPLPEASPANVLERVETEVEGVQELQMRRPFRIMLHGIGLLMLAGVPLAALMLMVTGLSHGDWNQVALCLAAMAFSVTRASPGWLLIRAARSGVDPRSEDRALEEAESRAMLAAVERAGGQEPAR